MDRYRELLERLDAWFARGRERHPGVVPCAAGCSACCHGPFDISVADVALVRRGLAKLAPDARADVLRRARALLDRARALEPGWAAPYAVVSMGEERFDRLCEALAAEPCPLLDERGRCRIYEDRPLVCRLIGLPMIDRPPPNPCIPSEERAEPATCRRIENSCPIASGFPDYAALPPVEFDLDAFEEEEHDRLREAAREVFGGEEFADYETFIAAGVVLLIGGAPETP